MVIFRAIMGLLLFVAGLVIAMFGAAFVATIVLSPIGLGIISAGVTIMGVGGAVAGAGRQ